MEEVLVEFDRLGSLPATHESQGSDMGLFGGLLGWEADDERLPHSAVALAEAGVRLRFHTVDVGDPHPNTYRLTLKNAGETHSLVAVSTGGGMIEVVELDGMEVSLDGGSEVPLQRGDNGTLRLCGEGEEDAAVRMLSRVLPVPSRKGVEVPFTSCAQMLARDADRHTPLWELAVQYEAVRSGFSAEEIISRMEVIVRILRKSIDQGIAGTSYEDRVLHHQSGRFAEQMKAGRLLDGGALNQMILYVTALMEVKSSMGVIVAAPTAGACAALPGAVIAMAEVMGKGPREMAEAMLAAGVVGVFIATRWTFAAEVGGCQAEGGAAACMAAAALVTLAGGTRDEALAAASLAFQSMLGLICDPIANRVEAPCLGKNVMAAANALSCANMALAGYDPLIPLDEVIDAAKSVAQAMPREHRCTSLGGLAVTPTSLKIEEKLRAGKTSRCGGCAC